MIPSLLPNVKLDKKDGDRDYDDANTDGAGGAIGAVIAA